MKKFGFCQVESSLPRRSPSAKRRDPQVLATRRPVCLSITIAKVVLHLQLLAHVQGVRVDLVADGAAVGAVLGNRDPDVGAVKVDAAGVVHVALTQNDVLLEVPVLVHDEQVPDALARRAVETILRGRELGGRFGDLDGREEYVVLAERDSFGVVGREVQLQLGGLLPFRVSIHAAEGFRQGGVAFVMAAGAGVGSAMLVEFAVSLGDSGAADRGDCQGDGCGGREDASGCESRSLGSLSMADFDRTPPTYSAVMNRSWSDRERREVPPSSAHRFVTGR